MVDPAGIAPHDAILRAATVVADTTVNMSTCTMPAQTMLAHVNARDGPPPHAAHAGEDVQEMAYLAERCERNTPRPPSMRDLA